MLDVSIENVKEDHQKELAAVAKEARIQEEKAVALAIEQAQASSKKELATLRLQYEYRLLLLRRRTAVAEDEWETAQMSSFAEQEARMEMAEQLA
eukprot:SAG31_NODE_30263_length_383_cov_1.028169_1_plen_94_part_01